MNDNWRNIRIALIDPSQGRNLRYGLWLLKKSLQWQKLPKLGDQKCIPRWRKSFIEHPSASSFLCADADRLFQQPRLFTTIDERYDSHMSKRTDGDWLKDAESRQQNTVFPDTVRNEGEFYRGIANRPLTRAGKVGFALLSAFVIVPMAIVIHAVVSTAALKYPDPTIRTESILLTLGTIVAGAALFILILYVALKHGVDRFASQHRGRFRRS